MKLPLVSVIMPTLNSAPFVREAIHSLIDQAYTRFELIVVDGGSTDETIGIVESYLGDDDLTIIKLPPQTGQPAQTAQSGMQRPRGNSSRAWTPTTPPTNGDCTIR